MSFFIGLFAMGGILFLGMWAITRPMSGEDKAIVFVVPQQKNSFSLAQELEKQHFIRNAFWFTVLSAFIHNNEDAVSGGYALSYSMTMFEIMNNVYDHPEFVWVTIREGLRKEQIGESLAMQLGWNNTKIDEWNMVNNDSVEYKEGVYFPDTYLLPVDGTPSQTAKRFIDKFNEKVEPFMQQFTANNIKWTTGIKIASLIQREAAGVNDMKLISGIIWNRLNSGMKLEIDATMQYTKGKVNDTWWGGIDLKEKQSDSLYNTYRYKGLPPTPICNPGIAAIEAALNPLETTCIFYLHDKSQNIHCAETYDEHLENIDSYLSY